MATLVSSAFRILHTADSHIGAEWPRRPRKRLPRRGDDFVSSFERVCRAAAEQDVQLVLHAGDLFDSPDPSAQALAAAAAPLMTLAARGIPVVLLPGNHERSAIPSSVLLSHPNIHMVREPTTLFFRINGIRLAVAAVPALRRDAANLFSRALEATRWDRVRADVRMLAVHEIFESATCGPANHRFRRGPNVIERDAVPSAFDYVACGHVHRRQTLRARNGSGAPIVYCGSTDRITFAERDEPKGYVMIDVDRGALLHRFVEHPVRPMETIPLCVDGLTRHAIAERFEAALLRLPADAVAQFRLAGHTSREAALGLRLRERAAALRPDVLLAVQARDLDHSTNGGARPHRRTPRSAFADLDAPAAAIDRVRAADVHQLPTRRGVYAIYDQDRKLLYVGKAANGRTRVQSHLRAGRRRRRGAAGWGRFAALVEFRPTHSELESLLIEAELIRRLRPAFNVQMRRWTFYCYLYDPCRAGCELEVRMQPPEGGACFGPYRGRWTAEAIRDAVEALGEMESDETAARARIHALLWGRDDGALKSFLDKPSSARRRKNVGAASRRANATPAGRVSRPAGRGGRSSAAEHKRRVEALSFAFERGRLLREAEALLGGVAMMPGFSDRRKAAIFTSQGVVFEEMAPLEPEAERVLRRAKSLTARGRPGPGSRLTRESADVMCIAARMLARERKRYAVISAAQMESMDPEGFLAGTTL